MNFLQAKTVLNVATRNIKSSAAAMVKWRIPTQFEHAAGLERAEMLARLDGDDDPWNSKPIKRTGAMGQKDNPVKIPSAYDKRVVGCVCHEESQIVRWMWIHSGENKRCECGYWFELVYKKPLLERYQ